MRRPMVILGLAVLGSACTEKVRPTSEHNCVQVYYDGGGGRLVVTGKEVEKLSDTHVRVKDVKFRGGMTIYTPDTQVEVTSSNIAIVEGSCHPY